MVIWDKNEFPEEENCYFCKNLDDEFNGINFDPVQLECPKCNINLMIENNLNSMQIQDEKNNIVYHVYSCQKCGHQLTGSDLYP
jgi:C4-type Zn-finger protein